MPWLRKGANEVEERPVGVEEAAADSGAETEPQPAVVEAANGHKGTPLDTVDLWSAEKKDRRPHERGRKPERLATGVVVDGATAHRAQVRNGHVVAYEAFREATPRDALRKALDGTRGARVVFLQGLLFSEDVELPKVPGRLLPNALVELGKEKWPAAEPAAVAALPLAQEESAGASGQGPRRAALAGWDLSASDDFWALLERAGARLVPLPFVVPSDGVWLFSGLDRSWLVVLREKEFLACRELKAGASDVQQLSSQVSVEVSRLTKSGEVNGAVVFACGLVLDQATLAAFSRLGALASSPPLPGISRWELPWAEQGSASLPVLAALADLPTIAVYRSRAEIARIVEAPRRRARLAVIGGASAVALGVLGAAVLSWSSASSSLSSAKSALATATQEAASVSHWISLRSNVLSVSGKIAQLRSPDAAFGPALSMITGTAPPGAQVSTIGSNLQDGQVTMTVAAIVPNGTFGDIAIWQQRMEAFGATVQVVGESRTQEGASVSMNVSVPVSKGSK